MGGFKNIVAEKINFEKVGDEVVGILLSAEEAGGDLDTKSYVVKREDGKLVSFLGTVKMNQCLPEQIGKLIKVTFTGELKTSSKRTMKNFDIAVWEDEEDESKD